MAIWILLEAAGLIAALGWVGVGIVGGIGLGWLLLEACINSYEPKVDHDTPKYGPVRK